MKTQHPWQTELAKIITEPAELASLLQLEPNLIAEMAAASQFPLRVTHSFVARMEKANPKDPLLLQIFPSQQELQPAANFSTDPLQEKKANFIPGLLHKYQDRVLLMPTSACAIHCRYCFRRHFPYEENMQANWPKIAVYLQEHPAIKEVILSGGDPLIVKDQPLQNLLEKIAEIPHIKRLRIHSRLPIVLPNRITDELVMALTATRLKPVMIVHANHANEINDEVKASIKKLLQAEIPVFNQAVLLKDINDDATTLTNLSETLFAAGIIPYYLHLLDKVQGAAHFDVTENIAQQLIRDMMKQLPGYLVPKLVKEQAEAPSKLLISI